MSCGSSIVSGDTAASVAPVAAQLGLTAQTGMRPQDKLDAIARLSAGGAKVAIIDEPLARQLFGGVDPIGERVQILRSDTAVEPLEKLLP